jgi:spore coat protein CotH
MKPFKLRTELIAYHKWFVNNDMFKEALIIRTAIKVISVIDDNWIIPYISDDEEQEVLETI